MPAEITTVIDNLASTTMSFIGTTITDYLPWILGLAFLGAIAYSIKRAFFRVV